MALGVRLLYPVDVESYDASAQFIDYDAKYLVTDADRGLVTLRFRALSYDDFGEETETPSTTYPITHVEISNTPDFATGRVLTLSYAERTTYDVPTLTGGSIGAMDDDYDTQCMRVTNWALDAGEGQKTVYIRFVCSGGQTFPDPDGIYKGFQDWTIVARTDPSMPKTLRVDNETDDHWVPRDTIFSWQESQDNISGLRGYDFDLIIEGDESFPEECNDLSDFDILDRYTSDARLASDQAVMRTRRTAALLPSDLTWEALAGQSKVEASFANTSATPMGHEVQWENWIQDGDDDGVNNLEVKMKVRPTFPDTPGAGSSIYAAIQTFQGLYEGAHSVSMIPATTTVVMAPWSRRSGIDATVTVEMNTTTTLMQPLTAAVMVVENKNTPCRSFSLLDGAVQVAGVKRLLSTSGTIVYRSDSWSYYGYTFNVSDTYEQTLAEGAVHHYLRASASPDGVHGYVAFVVQDLMDSSFDHEARIVRVPAAYASTYGEMSSADLAKCHVRASIWTLNSVDGTLTRRSTWDVPTDPFYGYVEDYDSEATFVGLGVAPEDPVATKGEYNTPYTHSEVGPWGSDGDGTWTPEDPTWLSFTFPPDAYWHLVAGLPQPAYMVPALLIEVWADISLGHPAPELRIPYCIEWQTATLGYDSGTCYGYYGISKTAIYEPDGSISGYDPYSYSSLIQETGPGRGSPGSIFARVETAPAYAHTVNQIPAAVIVVGTKSPTTSTIPGTVTVLQSLLTGGRSSIEAAAEVVQPGPGSGRRLLPVAVVVSRDVTRTSTAFIEATVTVEHTSGSGTSVSSIEAIVDVTNVHHGYSTIPAAVVVEYDTGVGGNSVSFIPATVFVSAPWEQDPIYVDLSTVHTTINGMAPAWSDFILVDFDLDGTFTLYRPTWDGSGQMTGYSSVTETGVTDAGIEDLGDDDVEIEVAYRENRYDVEEVSLSSFGTETPIDIEDSSRAWGDALTVLWQPFVATMANRQFGKVVVRVDNQEPGGDYFHVQGIILAAKSSGLPDVSSWANSRDPRTDIFGVDSAGGLATVQLRSCTWPDGSSFPTTDSGSDRLWSEVVWIPAGTSDVSLALANFPVSSPLQLATLTAGRTYLLGLAFNRVDASLGPDPGMTFSSPGVDENFVYSPFRPLIRWKVLNVTLDSALNERLVSGRALASGAGINEYQATGQPTNQAIFKLADATGSPVFTTLPEELPQTKAELIVSYARVDGDTTDRASHRYDVTPLQASPSRHAVVGMRADTMGSGEWAAITYDYLRFSDTSIIPNIDLSDAVGYTIESQQEFEEEVHLVTTQVDWTDADWGTTWAKRFGANGGVDISNATGDLVFNSLPGDPDDTLRSAEAQYLTPTQGDSFSLTVSVDLSAQRLDAEFYVYVLPGMYSANVSDIDEVGDDTPQDFMIIGFRYNGDIYLYRPDPNTGLVSAEMIHTLGSLIPYDWASGDVRIRLTNATAGVTALSVWHDLSLLYSSDSHKEFRPESDRGFWVGMGLRTRRDTTGALRLDVGNIKIQSVSRANPDIVNSVLFTEGFAAVPIRWFTWPGIEEVRSGGSSVIHGIVRQNPAEEYAAAHRVIAPSNVYSQPLFTTAVPPGDTLDVYGNPDFYRMRMGVSIDSVDDVPQLTEIVRWIGPSMISPYGIYNLTTSDAIRIDLNYELSYPDDAGNSQVIFGLASWLPTNAAAPLTNLVTAEDYACYSFTETDDNTLSARFNTRAQVNALLTGGTTGRIGYESEQYLTTKQPSFALIAFGSDLKAYCVYGKHTSGDSESARPTTTTLDTSFLPDRGVLSLIIKPVTTGGGNGGDEDEVTVSITATPSRITQGSSTLLAWTSQNAVSVVSSNFGATAVTGQKTVSPTASQTYTITVEGADGSRASASVYVTVDPPGVGPSVDISANPMTINPGESSILTWTSQNATEVVLSKTNVPGITQYQLSGSVSVQPATTTTYTITVKNASGVEAADSVTVTIGSVPDVSVSLAADPTSSQSGEPVLLTWTSQNATQVIDSGPSPAFVVTTVNGTRTVYPTANTTYWIRVANADRSKTAYAEAIVTIQNSLTGTADVNPKTGNVGTVVTYSYSVPHASVGQVIISGPGMVDQHIDMNLPSGSGTFTLTTPGTYSFYFGANTYEPGYSPSSWSKTVEVTCGNYPSGSHVPPTHVYQYSYETPGGWSANPPYYNTEIFTDRVANYYTPGNNQWDDQYSWRISEAIYNDYDYTWYGGLALATWYHHDDTGAPPAIVDGAYVILSMGYTSEWAPTWTTKTETTYVPYVVTYTFTYVSEWAEVQNKYRPREIAIGPPAWLPPVNSNVTAFTLVLTSTKGQSPKTGEKVEGWKSDVGSTPPSGSGNAWTGSLPLLWWARSASSPATGLPNVVWDATGTYEPYGQQVITKTYTAGETVSFNILTSGVQWVNNGAASHGIRIGLLANNYLSTTFGWGPPNFQQWEQVTDVGVYVEGSYGEWPPPDPSDHYMWMLSNRVDLEFAGATHVTPQWRPYYVISYTTVGGLSVTARVPVGDAAVATIPSDSDLPPDEYLVSAQSTGMVSAMADSGDPIYADIEVRVNNVHYVTAEGVPFNFNSQDGARLVCAARRKTPGSTFDVSATVDKFSLSYINIRALPSDEDAETLAMWIKTNGNVAANTLFYGRNLDVWQEEDDEASPFEVVVGQSGTSTVASVVAQRFVAGTTKIRAASVRTNSTTTGMIKAYLSAVDSDGEPLVTPAVDGHISPTNSNILATAFGRHGPGTTETFFVFDLPPTLTIGTRYALVIDYAVSLWGTDEVGTLPGNSSLRWSDSAWVDTGVVLCFRTFGDVYVNRENQHHARRLSGRVASTNNAGLMSQHTLPATTVRADLLPPYAVGSTEDPPTIQIGPTVQVQEENEGFIVALKIGAQDTLALGSGVDDFRVVYETDFGEMHATDYKSWVDGDSDGYVTFELYYSGMFLDTRRFYVEVRDAVGNVARSVDLLVDFIYSYYQDTKAPHMVIVRIEGDAFIDPDPNEAEATSETDVDVSLNVQDATTGCKDFRVNRNFAETPTGGLVYDDYRPYLFEFDDRLVGADGIYAIGVQARDYADNATQPTYEHIERIAFDGRSTVRELATAVASYYGALYVGTTRRTARMSVTCTNTSVIGYEAYTVYEPWIGNARQTIGTSETVVVRIDGGVVTNYTVDYDNDWIVFDDPLGPEYDVQMDIVEEVAVLYRYTASRKRAVKVFDNEGERTISALQPYQGMLYVGTGSGRIYAYNGIRTSLSLYRTTDALGAAVPVSCMAIGQFDSDDELEYDDFLYVGTYESPHVFRYGGNPANSELGWNRISTLSTAMTSDESVYAIAMYEDTLWIATGPYGRVHGYTRTLDDDGDVVEATRVSQLYASEFTSDPNFRMDVLCLEPWDGRIYAGVDHASSVFVYEIVREDQPTEEEWLSQFEFNYDFKNSPLPWEFYNEGNVDHRNSDRISFMQVRDDTTGELSDYYMTMDGRAGEFCCWIDRSQITSSKWLGVSNATGWTMEFDLRLQDWGEDATECYQGVTAYDGTYMVEFRLHSDRIVVASGQASDAVALSIDVTQWHTYRIAVVGDSVTIYVDGDNTPVLRSEDLLEFETTGRAILFGKVEGTSGACNAQWRRLWHYLSGALAPKEVVERDWTRAQVIPFGNEVRYLVGTTNYLVVGVQPRLPSELTTYDDPTMLVPRTYRRETGLDNVWQVDAIYESDVASLLSATLHDDHVWSTAEVSSDLLTNEQVDLPEFITEDPPTAMLDNANVYERRLTQPYDTIIKDTRGPDGAVIINEDTAAGSVQVFAMESYSGSGQHTGGFVATYSPLGVEVGSGNSVIDGVPETYVSIGTPEVRYVGHDFGGDGDTTVDLTEIKWGCRSITRKTYEVQYLDPDTGEWVMVASMISDRYGDATFYRVVFSPTVAANGVRIYYTGDRETASNDVELSLSAVDDGVGTAGYKLSRYQDMRDALSWTPMTDGTIRLSWELTQDAETWSTVRSTTMPFTAGTVFGSYMVLAAADGHLHVTSDGESFVTSTFQAAHRINCFAEYRDALYLGTDDGKLYSSENAIDWTLIESDVEDRITSLATFGDVLYVGTGDSGYLMTYDGSTLTAVRKFASESITAMFSEGSGTSARLHIGLTPTGQIYVYDGSAFTQAVDTPVNRITAIAPYRDVPYAACDKGRIYKYTTLSSSGQRAWTLMIDTARRRISGLTEHAAIGPTITSISSEGVGSLASGTYSYLITWIDHAGVESMAGEAYEFDNLSNVGRVKVEWQTIENARGYKIYRSPEPNRGTGTERQIDVDELTDTYFYDDGSYTVLDGSVGEDDEGNEVLVDDVAPPTTSTRVAWFTGDSAYAYTWDGSGFVQVPLPSDVQGANGVLSFRSQVYVYGQERAYTDAELTAVEGGSEPVIAGKVTKWIGAGTGAGERVVYAQFIDGIDNETSLLSDTIYYDTLLEHRIVEVDPNGTIVLEYESQSDPQEKLYSPHKMLEQVGIYESQPFYASNLSRWDVIEMLAQLPYDTSVRLYVRTAETRAACLLEDWTGPFTLENLTPDLYYQPYDSYEYGAYGYHYVDRSYYYYGEGIVTTQTADISSLEGPWLQFKLELVTERKDVGPTVFYVVVRYKSTNAAMFYTTVFDLDAIANRERPQSGGIEARRGIITWNGHVPEGGDVRFGISTVEPETGDWSDYQEVTPNTTFEIDDPGDVKVAIMLISTDTDVAIVDEWAMMLDTGDRDVRINLES